MSIHVVLMYSTHRPSPYHLDRLRGLSPNLKISVCDSEASALAAAAEAEAIFGHRYLRQCLPATRRLRWVQSTAAGIDRLPLAELAQKRVRLTRMTLAAPVIARHAVTLAWAITRGLVDAAASQAQGVWQPARSWLPWPKRAVVLGTGTVGRAIADLLRADGLEVVGIKRDLAGPAPPGFAGLCDRSNWRSALPQADWCFLALPFTSETEGLVDEAALRALPPHAVFVNVGRGETLKTDSLCRVLREGHLGGAALDVVSPEPAGPEDALWKTPRLLVTPHVAAHYHERDADVEAFCEGQLGRYLREQPLLDEVDLHGARR